MESFDDLVLSRRSYRTFTNEEIDAEDLHKILRAALLSPTSKNRCSWHFVVVDDKMKIEKLADCKEHGAEFLKSAQIAIVVMANPKENDCWVEDCSIATISMQYQAEDLGLGTCWIQTRGRALSSGQTSDEVIRGILDISEEFNTLCILALGHTVKKAREHNEEELRWENVHL